MDYVGLGRRIRAARHELNMTQEQLSAQAGISLSFLGHVERGTRKASLETIVALANVLDKSLDTLMQDSLKYENKGVTDQNNEELALLREINRVVFDTLGRWND